MLTKSKLYISSHLTNSAFGINTWFFISSPEITPTKGTDLDLFSLPLKAFQTPNKAQMLVAHLWVSPKCWLNSFDGVK